MFITGPRIKCSECGAIECWERYSQSCGESGIRCLKCGHEKENKINPAVHDTLTYTYKPPEFEEF